MAEFIISDTHFGHANIIKHCDRPFESVEHMNATMLNNWNAVVSDKDTVYHLGDFMSFKKKEYEASKETVSKLNGNILLVKGNHDVLDLESSSPFNKPKAKFLPLIHNLKYNKRKLVLSHYPMRSWNGMYHGSLHFFGHVHGNLDNTPLPNAVDVGVDSISNIQLTNGGYRPVRLEEMIEYLEYLESKDQ